MKQRQTELDILRIAAIISVIMMHVCGDVWHDLPLDSTEWTVTSIYRMTWCVPVLVMISGRFFLDPERNVTVEKLYKKSIVRIVTAFLFWSACYQLYYFLMDIRINGNATLNWKGQIFSYLTGAYHLWYIFMIISLYAVTPLLRKITEDKKSMEYFILIFLITHFLRDFAPKLPLVGELAETITSKTYLYMAYGYTGYYVLGYYLHKYPIRGRAEKTLYLAGIGSYVLSTAYNMMYSRKIGVATEDWLRYQMPNVILFSAALYVFFVNRVSRVRWKQKTRAVISRAAECCFGIYLVHALVNELVPLLLGITPMSFAAILSVPIITAIVFAVSYLITVLIKKIPVISQYVT